MFKEVKSLKILKFKTGYVCARGNKNGNGITVLHFYLEMSHRFYLLILQLFYIIISLFI